MFCHIQNWSTVCMCVTCHVLSPHGDRMCWKVQLLQICHSFSSTTIICLSFPWCVCTCMCFCVLSLTIPPLICVELKFCIAFSRLQGYCCLHFCELCQIDYNYIETKGLLFLLWWFLSCVCPVVCLMEWLIWFDEVEGKYIDWLCMCDCFCQNVSLYHTYWPSNVYTILST